MFVFCWLKYNQKTKTKTKNEDRKTETRFLNSRNNVPYLSFVNFETSSEIDFQLFWHPLEIRIYDFCCVEFSLLFLFIFGLISCSTIWLWSLGGRVWCFLFRLRFRRSKEILLWYTARKRLFAKLGPLAQKRKGLLTKLAILLVSFEI